MGPLRWTLPTGKRIVAVDTETSGLHVDDGARISVISMAWRADCGEIVSRALPLAQAGVAPISPEKWKLWMDRLATNHVVGWNFKFDLHMLATGRDGYPGRDLSEALIWDGMLAEAILSPLERIGLEPTAQRHLGVDISWKEGVRKELLRVGRQMGLRGTSKRYDLLDWKIMRPYAKMDAEVTLRLYEFQCEMLETGYSWAQSLIERDVELLKVLFRMERRGIGFDVEGSREAARKLRRRVRQLRAEIPFTTTPAGARRFFFGSKAEGGLHLIPHKVTEAGTASIDKGVLLKLVANDVPHAATYHQFKRISTSLSSWYGAYADRTAEDGRLRTDYTLSTVVSNRLSSRRVNLQALPHDYRLVTEDGVPHVRALFLPKPGSDLWELDLSQAEIRVAAAVSDCRGLREAIEGGDADLHAATARTVFKVGADDERWFSYRQISKRLNFAMIYGAGSRALVATLAEDLGYRVSEAEARTWKDQYDRVFPELKQAYRRSQSFCEATGYIELVSGRKRWFRPFELERKAFNQRIQGSVAEAMKDWMIAVDAKYPGWLVLQIHDSLVMEMPRALADFVPRIARMGEEIFTQAFGLPFRVDVKKWGEK